MWRFAQRLHVRSLARKLRLISSVTRRQRAGSTPTAGGDSDGVCDNYPNYGSATGISFDDAYADHTYGWDPATYYAVSHGITISGV